MERPTKITIDGIEYNLITDEELEEIKFKQKLEDRLQDMRKGRVKTTSLAEARKMYARKIQR